MIAADQEAASNIVSTLRARSRTLELPPGTEALCDQLLQTTVDPAFPGALIPDRAMDGQLIVVAVASPADWRRLCPVLRAFAGPTLTSFDGVPSSDLVSSDLLSVIAEAGQGITAAIRLPSGPGDRDFALRALVRAHQTLNRAPSLSRAAPEPTSWLLARFQDHLNVGMRQAAEEVLNRLRDELRVDALNLRFLHAQLLATFEDWVGIVDMAGFANLTRARRTPAITALLLEALYQARLASRFDTGDAAAVEALYAQEVRDLAAPMLKVPLPPSLRSGGWRLVALEAIASPSREDLRRAASGRSGDLGWLAPRFAPSGVPEGEPGPRLGVADEARDRLVAGEEAESVDAMSAALTALARLDDKQRAELARAEPFRSALRALEEEAGGSRVPNSWSSWLARTSDPSFTNALALARLGAEEWPIAGEATDPAAASDLLTALERAQNDSLAAERSAQALPYIVAALQRDPRFPNLAMRSVYASLLTLLALGSARGASVYESSLTLVDALLCLGTDTAQYRDLAADVEEIAGEGFGVRMVYWTLEMIESFMRAPAPDPAARERLVHSILARLAPLRGRLSALQHAAVQSLAAEFGWALDEPPPSQHAEALATRLRGKSIAIYSLVESASRQAKIALQGLAMDLEVQCSSDQGGTAQLRTLAINTDLFVIAWAAAKHAATDFIRAHRKDKPLVFSQGKGVSSLLRAVEEHFIPQATSR